MKEYYEVLEENRELFDKALEAAKDIAAKARKLFGDCEVYIVGSYARQEHKLSSDLDILIVSDNIPEKMEFEWYSRVAKSLTGDPRIEIHLVNKRRFKQVEKLYTPRLKVESCAEEGA